MKATPGIPTAQEERKKVRDDVRQSEPSRFYSSFAEVSHEISWGDGETIWLVNGTDWEMFVFRRTGNKPDSGEWLETGIITGAVASW